MVFYRKYRSQTIHDLDSTAIRETLLRLLQKTESIPHAFLFTGPKGLGKTSTARIVAKVVNCQKRLAINQGLRTKDREQKSSQLAAAAAIEPCNQCDQCVSITNGTNLDVFEIDAASNRGIDEIRDLKEKIRLSPVSATKKVYIIDEVHMLTTEAFNALLKTLEEPPEHAMFILCTTEAYKVPETIASRCFQIVFKKATDEEIKRSLERITEGEHLQFKPENDRDEILLLVAKRAYGGFRDAAKILEELVLMANSEPITKDLFEKIHRSEGLSLSSVRMIAAIFPPHKRDIKNGLEFVKRLVDESTDMKLFIQMVLTDIHTLLLIKTGIEKDHPYTSYAEWYEIADLKLLIGLLDKAYQEMKYAVLSQLPLELAIIEWCALSSNPHPQRSQVNSLSSPKVSHYAEASTTNASSPLRGEDRGEGEKLQGSKKQGTVSGPTTVNDLRKQVGAMKKLQALYGETKVADADLAPKITAEHPVDLMHTFPDGEVTKEWLNALWSGIIMEMKQYNHTIAGVLRGCMIKSYDKKVLIIETSYKFHKEKLDEAKTRDTLFKVCKLLTGNEVEVTIELKG